MTGSGPSTTAARGLSHAWRVRLRDDAKKANVLATAALRVNETFASVQGEGSLIGVLSLFIRLDGCPLRCAWCDTPYALEGDRGAPTPVDDLASLADAYGHVVITGGEPLAQDIRPLVEAIGRSRHITVETSGTIFADLPQVSLFSISPKVGSSGYTPKPAVLRKFCATAGGRMHLKFVIAGDRDLREALACVESIRDALPAATPIILQPESASAGRGAAYLRRLRTLAETVIADPGWRGFDVRVLPQLHYLLWDGEPGR